MGIGFFAILFWLAVALRLGIPVLYILLMSTAFSEWYDAHELLADEILIAMLILVAVSWAWSAVRKVQEFI